MATSTGGVSRGSVQTPAQAEGESVEEEDSAEDLWEDAPEFLPDGVNNLPHGLCGDLIRCPEFLGLSGRVVGHPNPRENLESAQKEKNSASRQQHHLTSAQQQQQHQLASMQGQQQQGSKAAQPKKLSKQSSKTSVAKNSKSTSQQQQQQGNGGRGENAAQGKKSSKNVPGGRPPADASDTQPRSPIDKRRRDRHGGGGSSTVAESSSASLDRNTKLHLPVGAPTAATNKSSSRSDSPLQKSPVNSLAVSKVVTGGHSSGSAGRGSPVVAYANGEEGPWSSQEQPPVSDDWGSGNDTEGIDDAISKCSTDDDKIRSQQNRGWTPITTVASSTTAMSTTVSSGSSSCSVSSRPWQEVSRAIKTCQLTVANSLVGRIIGRRGSKINQIQEASGAQISISRAIPRSVERLVTIKGTDRSLNKARELIEEALSTPSREIELDQSLQTPNLTSTPTDSPAHGSYPTTTHTPWVHKRQQPEPAMASSSHPPTCAAGLGPSSFATAVIGNAGARRSANHPMLIPVATTAPPPEVIPPEMPPMVSNRVTCQQLVGERGGETRGNACAASSPSPSSCATPTSASSVATSSEPTHAKSTDGEKSFASAADGSQEDEDENSETDEETDTLQSPRVHARSGSEPLIRSTSSISSGFGQSNPSCSLPSLVGQPPSTSPQISVVIPSLDPVSKSASISIITSTSVPKPSAEEKATSLSSSVVTGAARSTKTVGIVTPTQAVKPVQRDNVTVTLSTPVIVSLPTCSGASSASSGGSGACGFGAIGPPNRRSSVPASNSFNPDPSPERKLSYAGISVSKGLSSVPEFHPTSSSLTNSFSQRDYSWPPTHAPPPPSGPSHATPLPPPGHMTYASSFSGSWRNNGWPPQPLSENERTRSQSWAGLVQPFGPVASSHQENPPPNMSNSFGGENHGVMWGERSYHHPPSQFRPQFNRPHSSAAVYGNMGAGVQGSGYGDPFSLGGGNIRPVQSSFANHGHMPGHGHAQSQQQSQQLSYNMSYFPNSSAALRSQPHSHFQNPHSQNYLSLQPQSHSSLPRSQSTTLQSQAQKPKQQQQQPTNDSNNSPLSLRQVLGEKLEREIFPGEGGLSMDFKDDSPSHSKRWSVSSFPPNLTSEGSSGMARDSSTWAAPSLTSGHGRHSVVGANPSLCLNDNLLSNLTSWPIWSNSASPIAPPSLFADSLPTSAGGGGPTTGSGENWDQGSPSGTQDQQNDTDSNHDTTDLYTLMRKLDIAEHIPALQNQNLSLQQLCTMSDEEWRGLKLPVGPRVKLMNAVVNIAASRSSGGSTLDVDGVSDPPFSSANSVGQS